MTLFADIAGERLDAFLARSVPDLSRSAAQKLIEDGQVRRNGKPGRKNDKLNIGDASSTNFPSRKQWTSPQKKSRWTSSTRTMTFWLSTSPRGLWFTRRQVTRMTRW